MSALKKKYGDSEIGTVSRDLVAKWKASVAKEEEDRENEESEEVVENGNDDPMLPSSEYSVPEYVPSRISTVEANKASSADENILEKGDDEEQYSRKSKKKKSHRERSEDRESNRSDKTHKHKKDKEREKKQKHSEREKDKESRSSSSSSKDKDHKRKSSHRDRHRENDVKTKESRKDKKCDINEASDQGDRNKHKTDNARHGIHGNQGELKHKSEEKHSRSKHNDLSSFDMFSKPSLEHKEEKASSRKRQGDAIEDNSFAKHPKMLDSSQKNDLPSLPSSLSGTNLIPDISPIYKPLPRTNPFLAEKQKTEGKNDIDLSVLLSSKNRGMSRIYRYELFFFNLYLSSLCSGVKRSGFIGGDVPSLHSQCIQVLKENVDYIEEVGGLPYEIMKPVLLMATDTTLMRIEDCNPHLMEYTGEVCVPIQRSKDTLNSFWHTIGIFLTIKT